MVRRHITLRRSRIALTIAPSRVRIPSHPALVCVGCGFPAVHARRRCRTCYRYQRGAHGGADRSEEMIVRAELRRMEMEEHRRRVRLAAGWSTYTPRFRKRPLAAAAATPATRVVRPWCN